MLVCYCTADALKRHERANAFNLVVLSFCCVVNVQSTQSSTYLTDVTNEIASHSSPPRDSPIPTPPVSVSSSQQPFSSQSLFNTPLRFSYSLYHHMLPSFQWADGSDVWTVMMEKETKSTFRRDPDMFERHAALDARMRSILLDWLIEVIILYDIIQSSYFDITKKCH